MRHAYRFFIAALCAVVLSGCAEHDPILPGVRTPVFNTNDIRVMDANVENLPDTIDSTDTPECPYTQDSSNVIWDGDRKIFSGFPTNNSVQSNQSPICANGYVYAGLTTGEVVKIAPKSRKIIWIADVFRHSNMTGGASIVDIIAPLVIHKGALYVGGLGDAFCRINTSSGDKKWCVNIGVAVPFIVMDNVAFVVTTDNNLYAIRTTDGAVYWRTPVKNQVAPIYSNKIISVGDMKINAENGEIISD